MLYPHLRPVWRCWSYLNRYFRERSDYGRSRPLSPELIEWYIRVEAISGEAAWDLRRYVPLLDRIYRDHEAERAKEEASKRNNGNTNTTTGRARQPRPAAARRR